MGDIVDFDWSEREKNGDLSKLSAGSSEKLESSKKKKKRAENFFQHPEMKMIKTFPQQLNNINSLKTNLILSSLGASTKNRYASV